MFTFFCIVISICIVCYVIVQYDKSGVHDRGFTKTNYSVIDKQKSYLKALSISKVDEMDGLDFEHYICSILKDRGHKAFVTSGSNDYGVDVIADIEENKYAIQVKRYSSNVSRRAVSDCVAGMKYYDCNKSMVICNSYYTKGAIDLASANSCELIDRDSLAKWIYDFQFEKVRQEDQNVDIELILDNTINNKIASVENVLDDRDDILSNCDEEIRKIALREYPRDNEMQEYTYDEQLSSKLYMAEVDDAELKSLSVREYPNDYSMQESEYDEQLKGKLYMNQMDDEELKLLVIREYPNDYSMQESEYDEQLKGKLFMNRVDDEELKSFVIREHPNDYSMQESEYCDQLKSKKYMTQVRDIELKQFVVDEYPIDYGMQEYSYKEELRAMRHRNKSIPNKSRNALHMQYR